jgi:sulfatase maturation enzyme AslB (radical SAM superfamily)
LTRVQGSYRRILQALSNMQRLGIQGRVNSVVSNVNYRRLAQFFEVLLPYSVAAINLIVFNPSETTVSLPDDDGTRIEDYWTISREMGAALTSYRDRFAQINVRFLPFCLLPGHEDLIRTQWQKMYEDQEWDPFLNIAFQKGYWAACGAMIAGLPLHPIEAPREGSRDLYTLLNEALTTFRVKVYYRKPEACKRCSLRRICTGLPVDYVKRFDKTELVPYALGTVVNDPLHFCQANTEHFRSLRQ